MRYRARVTVLLIFSSVGWVAKAYNVHDLSSSSGLASLLGWTPQKNAPNLCEGYYKELPILYSPNLSFSSQTNNYDIDADNTELSLKGGSELHGHVRVTQPNQSLQADKAYIDRDHQGKISTVRLFGRVRYYTPGEMVVAKAGQANLQQKTVHLHDAAFRVNLGTPDVKKVKSQKTGSTERHIYGVNFWGTAASMSQTKPKHYLFKDASYTTCSPACHTWRMHSTTVNVDKASQRGDAWNTVLYWKSVPVFYMPYVNFPLDHKRKTGFLFPSYEHTTNSGYAVTLPFYWNIAPNYDALFNTKMYSLRGLFEDGRFRYLTHKSNGTLSGSFVPSDRAFASFRKKALNNPDYINGSPQALDRLRDDSDKRYSLHWDNTTRFNSNWLASANYTKVSDDYYVQDFNNQYILDGNQNDLLQAANVAYQGTHWSASALVQAYQTLHPINESTVINQYESLPALYVNGDYPQVWHRLDAGLGFQAIRFYQEKTPDVSTVPVVGNRESLNPLIDYHFIGGMGYLTPKVQFRFTQYQLDHIGQLQRTNPNSGLPIVTLHGGTTLERSMNLFHQSLIQTLEPELYYLYVPYHNQNNLPIFDTYAQQFTYSQLFQDNRFSGIDRVGDANQLSYALTSRLINGETGQQQASASIGEIAYFRNRDVQLCDANQGNCDAVPANDRRPFSPVAGQAQYNLTQHWSGTLGATWAPYNHRFDYKNATIEYSRDANHLFNVNYTFVSNSENDLPGLKSAGFSTYWQVHKRWDLIGAWNHQWGETVGDTYFAGLGYESCCWGARAVVMRSFDRIDTSGKFKYNTSVFVQFVLKGLGGYGGDSVGNALRSYVQNYSDQFLKTG
ncbi:MAG: hypothetical protein COV52_07935 [Gammaproteobacteria bacterium CG11_big_fil_rev_8_21_14_0_20_46_22]|nr:MAG: hypothetical protein COW05_04015 [Gammaproteobacteria bacterium CG12_big_fil_rev_8_21_14_0_65_46_12]PIR10686.1 MAG: hypothetical protein COV52_07935 [Gammaproteobacteria bacterium CG11_big_fil_rev_8_21_14_0_20_46_22]